MKEVISKKARRNHRRYIIRKIRLSHLRKERQQILALPSGSTVSVTVDAHKLLTRAITYKKSRNNKFQKQKNGHFWIKMKNYKKTPVPVIKKINTKPKSRRKTT